MESKSCKNYLTDPKCSPNVINLGTGPVISIIPTLILTVIQRTFAASSAAAGEPLLLFKQLTVGLSSILRWRCYHAVQPVFHYKLCSAAPWIWKFSVLELWQSWGFNSFFPAFHRHGHMQSERQLQQHFHPRLLDLFEVGISSCLLILVNLFFHNNEIKYRAPIPMNEKTAGQKLLLFVSYRDDLFSIFPRGVSISPLIVLLKAVWQLSASGQLAA